MSCPADLEPYSKAYMLEQKEAEPNSAKKPVIQHSLYGWQYSSAFTCSGLNNSTDAT